VISRTLNALLCFGQTRTHTVLAVCLPGVTVITLALHDLV